MTPTSLLDRAAELLVEFREKGYENPDAHPRVTQWLHDYEASKGGESPAPGPAPMADDEILKAIGVVMVRVLSSAGYQPWLNNLSWSLVVGAYQQHIPLGRIQEVIAAQYKRVSETRAVQ